MPSLSPYLQRRGFALNFRIAVPHDLRAMVGAREITKALPTNNRGAGALMALQCGVFVRRVFAELRAVRDEQDMDVLKLNEVMRAAREKLRLDAVKDAHFAEIVEGEHRRRRDVAQARLEGENEALHRVLRSLGVTPHAAAAGVPSPGMAPGGALPSAGASAAAAPSAAETLAPAAGLAAAAPVPTLKKVIDTFLDRHSRKKKAMLKKHEPVLRLFLQVVGDKPVSSIKQADVNRFFDTVQNLPPQWAAECRRRGISVVELAAGSHETTMSPKSFEDTYKASVRMFLKNARVHWQDEGFPVTLTTDAISYSGDREEGENKQRAFRDDELRRIFHGPELAGFRADPDLEQQFWLPYIGLYTGARVNEICQLNPQVDIAQDQDSGIWYFGFTQATEGDERIEKSIKNRQSRRLVPIHSHLIELGFIDYLERVKKTGAKLLFPAFKPSRGRASPAGETWFRHFMRELKLRDDTPHARLVGMHAFRSTMLARAHNANPPLDVTSITGHAANASDVVSGYQGTLWLVNQQRVLEAVPFGVRETAGDDR